MSFNGLFPQLEHYWGTKLKVAIIGAGLAGMSTGVELLDQGHEVDIYESRSFIGGKVGSFVDTHGSHIEMVVWDCTCFFCCYNNLFCLMKKVYSVSHMAKASNSMPSFLKGSTVSHLVQFCDHPEDINDPGDGGGFPVFSFLSASYFEKLAQELVEMFMLELNLKLHMLHFPFSQMTITFCVYLTTWLADVKL